MAYQISEHASSRCWERRIPAPILERLLDGAFVARAREDDGRISNHHIVRVARERYWVAIERDDLFITVIHVGHEGPAPRDWFSRRLINFRHIIGQIESLPVTSTRRLKRTHTRELADRRRWLEGQRRQGRGPAEPLGISWGISA